MGIKARAVDSAGVALSGAQVLLEIRNSGGSLVTSLQAFTDTAGYAAAKWKTAKTQPTGQYTARVVDALRGLVSLCAG